MTKDQLLILRDELANDPLSRYDGLSDAEVIASLNVQDRQTTRNIPIAELEAWSCRNRIIGRFYASNKQNSSLYHELDLLITGRQTEVDIFSNAGAQGIIADMITEGIISLEEAQEIQALGIVMKSRAEELGLPTVYQAQLDAIKMMEG